MVNTSGLPGRVREVAEVEESKSSLELLRDPFTDGWKNHEGDWVAIQDTKTGKTFYGRVRIKAVNCGKANCHKCPHHIYAYAQFRDRGKVREKYLGVAR